MESRNRSFRRLVGALNARLPELGLAQVDDPRSEYNRDWRLVSLLTAGVAGCAAGCKGLGEVESLTEALAQPIRPLLGIGRRVPDTTLRDILVKVEPDQLRQCLQRQVKRAHRRKALSAVGLPCGIVSIDGKYTKTPKWDDHYAQRQSGQNGHEGYGMVRTLTCSLITAAAVPCLDAVPIPAATNEMGHFKQAVSELETAYGVLDLYEIIMGDAGMCSLDNATYIHEKCQRGYIFRIKETQPTLLAEARRLLAAQEKNTALVEHAEFLPAGKTVIRRLWLTTEMEGWLDWTHLRTVFRLQVTTIEKDGTQTQQDRYYVSNVHKGRPGWPPFNPSNGSRSFEVIGTSRTTAMDGGAQPFDVIFQEDKRPWIKAPQGMVVVILLRRMAYNLMALYRAVTQRADDKRRRPWPALLKSLQWALLCATDEIIAGLRRRSTLVPDAAAGPA